MEIPNSDIPAVDATAMAEALEDVGSGISFCLVVGSFK
jgi:hypothetical protein